MTRSKKPLPPDGEGNSEGPLPLGEDAVSAAGDEPEFSLEQLSQAYAKVIRAQGVNRAPNQNIPPAEDVPRSPKPTESELSDEDDLELVTGELLDPVELDDRRDDAPCRISETTVLESILFVGSPPDLPLTARQLAGMMRDISPKEIAGLVAQLNEQYAAQGAAYRIVQQEKAYQLALLDELKPVRDAFYGEVRSAQLTQQAVEVLAVVAYNQPVSRSQIDKIRQRPSGAILSQLSERQLLAIDPQSESGRDRQYITTDRFLKLFGLGEIGDLPQAQEVDNIDEFFA
jgi:segregation and condensation protein B